MTTRTLVLLRHAKAERPDGLSDFDRKLTTAGETDADAAGAWLADERLHPGLVPCSSAARTRQTWQGVSIALAQAQTGGGSPEVRYDDGLYNGGVTELFDLVRRVPDTVRTVLVVGHNPWVSEVSLMLIPDDQYDGEAVELKTSGLAVHRSDHPWSSFEPRSMRLIERHTARG